MASNLASISCVVFLGALLLPSEAFITYIEVRLPLEGERAAPGTPWPLPNEWTKDGTLLTLHPTSFSMTSNLDTCDVISKAFERYKDLIFVKGGKGSEKMPMLKGISVEVTEKCEKYPSHEMDEAYELDITTDTAELKSGTVWGALRGLETFSQLVWENSDNEFRINETIIKDAPRFTYRGLLIDTSRHFIPMKILLANLDAMAYNKFNAFHWHIVDDQSFPYQSRDFPELHEKGAYSPKHVYTQADVAKVIEYARLRGIRLIPEFDTPGHTQSWGKSHPELLTPCYGDGKTPGTPNHPQHAGYEMFNPIQEKTYDFLKEFYKEVIDVFPEKYHHLGMDEVYDACWASSPKIKEFMTANNYTEVFQVQEYYTKRVTDLVNKMGAMTIVYHDPVDKNVTLDPNTIVQVWKDKSLDPKMDHWRNYIVPIAQKGYKMIVSSFWYLNYISYGPDWKRYYLEDPHDFPGTEKERNLVIGGEAALWMEYADGTNLLPRLWPRASAVAERLWSRKEVNDTDSAAFRLDQQRCRMLRRGIPAQPILNGFCGDYEAGMEVASEKDSGVMPHPSYGLTFLIFGFVLMIKSFIV